MHVESEWLPLLMRISASTAMTEGFGFGSGFAGVGGLAAMWPTGRDDGSSPSAISSVVEAMTDEERTYFQGFVDAYASSVAMQLSLFDAHGQYRTDVLPDELTTLDSRADWGWLAQLYLVEQYHAMVERGEVGLQRDGDAYWVDPIDLIDAKAEITSEIVLAAVAAAGNIRPGGGISRATAKTASMPLPEPRPLDGTAIPDGAPTRITGYTRHGREQSVGRDGGRGVSVAAMEDAVARPIDVTLQDNGGYKFTGETAVAVLNADGLIITGWARTRRAWVQRR